MSPGLSSGTLARAAATIWAVRSSGLIVVMEPLNARPIGDRAVATTTASGMAFASLVRDLLWQKGHLLLMGSLCRRWLATRVAHGSDNVEGSQEDQEGRPPGRWPLAHLRDRDDHARIRFPDADGG